MTDIDGNVYHSVIIGTQVWMVENLKTTHYNDGSAIPLDTNNNTLGGFTAGAYCWYNNDISNKIPYGALYNWYAVNTGKLAPGGWHVASDSEWSVLVAFVGGDSLAGGALKEAGTTHWVSPNTGATNNPCGFSALPGGYRYINGSFNSIGIDGFWWSSTAHGASYSWYRTMTNRNVDVKRYFNYNFFGYSARCVRDL